MLFQVRDSTGMFVYEINSTYNDPCSTPSIVNRYTLGFGVIAIPTINISRKLRIESPLTTVPAP